MRVQWLINTDDRIKSFSYEGQEVVTKRCTVPKAAVEAACADSFAIPAAAQVRTNCVV